LTHNLINRLQIFRFCDPNPTDPITIDTSKFIPEEIEKLQQALIDAPIVVVDVSGCE
jgi:ABC-type phosphate/phosphonate transport system substrate-binding protein